MIPLAVMLGLGVGALALTIYYVGMSIGRFVSGLLDKSNKLKIVVANTSANWYVHTDYFDK